MTLTSVMLLSQNHKIFKPRRYVIRIKDHADKTQILIQMIVLQYKHIITTLL